MSKSGGFPKKLYKLLGPGVAEEMNAMGPKLLDKAIVDAEEAIDESKKAMDEDEDLAKQKEVLKEMRGPYTDVMKAQRAKIAYALYLKLQEA